MITCDQYRDLAELLRDGALEPGEAAEARAHADGCPSCRRWEEGAAAVVAPLSGFPRGPYLPPPPPWGRIPPWAGGSVRGLALLVAVVLAGAGGAWVALGGSGGEGAGRGGAPVAATDPGASLAPSSSPPSSSSSSSSSSPHSPPSPLPPSPPLPPAGTSSLLGRIVGPDGAGLPGARVLGAGAAAGADGAGVFLLEGLPAGGARTVRVEPPGTPAFDVLVPFLRGGGTTAVLDAIPAGPGVEARVRVLGADARPLGGARVAALRTPAMRFPDPRPTFHPGSWRRTAAVGAAAGPDGVARLPGLAPGEWTFLVEAPGHAAAVLEARVGEDGDVAPDLVLLPAAALEGRVLDEATGEPLPGAEVQALPLFRRAFIGDERFAARAVAGPDGSFRLEGVPATTLLLAARRRGAGGWSGAVVVEAAIGVPVVVAVGADIPVDLDVVEEGTGRPLPGVPVLLRSGGVDTAGGTSREEVLLSGPGGRIPDGALLSGTRDAVVAAPLAGGAWAPAATPLLHVGAFRPGLRFPLPQAGFTPERLRARLSLVPSGTLEGTLRDAGGRPRGGAALEAVGLMRAAPPFPAMPSVLATTWTRADGRWRFPGLPPGPVLVRVARTGNPAEAMALLESGGPGTAVVKSGKRAVLDLSAPAPASDDVAMPGAPPATGPWSVAGRVTGPEGRPVEGARLRWKVESLPAGFEGGSRLLQSDTVSAREWAAVAGDGTFRLRGLRPGPDGVPGGTAVLLLTGSAEGLAARTVAVVLVAGEDPGQVEVRLEPGKSLSGRLLLPDGSPAAGVPLQVQGGLLPRRRVLGVTGADGSFTFPGLPGEAARVVAGWPHEPGTGWDLPAGEGSVTWTLAPAARCAGRVVDTEGRPVGGHPVRWEGRGAIPPRGTRRGWYGAFPIAGGAGAGFLLAGDSRGEREEEEYLPLLLPVGPAGVEGAELRLERGLPVAGRVEDGAGQGVGGAEVRVAFEHRGRRATRFVRSGADGSFRVGGLPEGDHAVVVKRGGAAVVVPAGAGATGVRVLLEGGGGAVLAGEVIGDGGRPADGVVLTAWPSEGGGSAGLSTTTDVLGRFRLEAPAAGGWTVVLRAFAPPSPVFLDGVAVGEGLRLDLRASSGEGLRGTVAGEGGKGLPGIPVTAIRILEGEGGEVVTVGAAPLVSGLPPSRLRCVLTGEGGAFHLGNPAGDWVVFAGWPGTATAAGPPEVRREGDRSPLGLHVGEGRTLRVSGGVDDDAPPEAARVEVRLEEFLPAGAAVPVVRGTLGAGLQLPGLPAGPVKVIWKDHEGTAIRREER